MEAPMFKLWKVPLVQWVLLACKAQLVPEAREENVASLEELPALADLASLARRENPGQWASGASRVKRAAWGQRAKMAVLAHVDLWDLLE